MVDRFNSSCLTLAVLSLFPEGLFETKNSFLAMLQALALAQLLVLLRVLLVVELSLDESVFKLEAGNVADD